MTYLVVTHPDDGAGHRVGAKGFGDESQFENTIEALEALTEADLAGEFDSEHFPYIEFDIQETKDGELVLFHDPLLTRAFPEEGPNIEPFRLLREQGINPETAGIKDLTIRQLHSLHLGGKKGVHVPTLDEFLKACSKCGVRRTLAVEVKAIDSDSARQKLLTLLSNYLNTHAKKLHLDETIRTLQYKPLGWAGIIAFPPFFTNSFGEFRSNAWRRWASELKRRGIPARCVHFHHLDFLYGAPDGAHED